jgi:trans-aconitate methyltransferase
MDEQQTAKLHDKRASVVFYEERYSRGYLEEWPADKKQRIAELLKSAELPESGEALDFGCGNGVLTEVIRRALPAGWTTTGTDVSAVAIQNARARYPLCRFSQADDDHLQGKQFDFLFTHHVIEHVYDLRQVFAEMSAFLKSQATMLHILPCGNEGSFEHRICRLRKDGINPRLENRFFFEDEGHVRRLKTTELGSLLETGGFRMTAEYYANQYHGAIDWITKSPLEFISRFTDASSAVDERSARELRHWRHRLLIGWAGRYPAMVVDTKLQMRRRSLRDWCLLALGLPLYPFTKSVDRYLTRRGQKEWESRKREANGSEMYLLFKR